MTSNYINSYSTNWWKEEVKYSLKRSAIGFEG